jgi:DNA-binding HxlR family transcriptional regulator
MSNLSPEEYIAEIRERLDTHVTHSRELARQIARTFSLDYEQTQVEVSRTLRTMFMVGEVKRIMLEEQEHGHLVYFLSQDERKLRRVLAARTKWEITQRAQSLTILHTLRDGGEEENLPEITTELFDVMIEDGLRTRFDGFVRRVTHVLLSSRRMLVIVVPNRGQKRRYLKLNLSPEGRAMVMSFREFCDFLEGLGR